jgi:hypothetical protein
MKPRLRRNQFTRAGSLLWNLERGDYLATPILWPPTADNENVW